MAIRIGEYLECGVLYNSRRNSTHGYIKLCGLETPIHIELTGDPCPELHGKALRFEPNSTPEAMPIPLPKHLRILHPYQVGPTGYMTINRGARTFHGYSLAAILELIKSQSTLPPSVWRRCLTLEWYSQNGRVLIELSEPHLLITDFKNANSDDESVWTAPPEPESWEPTDESANDAAAQGPKFEGLADEEDEHEWYPGCNRRDESEMSSEEYIHELEMMDDLLTSGPRGKSIHSFITECIPSGPLDELTDEEAESALKSVLASLALRSIAVHICEHYSTRDALHYLRTVVADIGEYHPELARSSFTQNYMTSEGCPQCEEQYEREYRERDAQMRKQMQSEEFEEPDGS